MCSRHRARPSKQSDSPGCCYSEAAAERRQAAAAGNNLAAQAAGSIPVAGRPAVVQTVGSIPAGPVADRRAADKSAAARLSSPVAGSFAQVAGTQGPSRCSSLLPTLSFQGRPMVRYNS